MGKAYLIVGEGNKPFLKSLELSRRRRVVVSDKPLEVEGLYEVLDIFKQFDQVLSLARELSESDDFVLDLYSHAFRLSAVSNHASLKLYLKLCELLTAIAKAKCFSLYISFCGSKGSKLYAKLKSIVDEEVPC